MALAMIFMPCFLKLSSAKAEISASSTGRMRSSTSTTVVCGAQRVVETGELDPYGARTDHEQFLRHVRRHQRVLVGPDALAIGLEPPAVHGPARPRRG